MNATRRPAGALRRLRRAFSGQASVEYVVVLAFGVMALLQPFSNPDTPGQPAESVLKQVARAIKDYHTHYTYALAIATIPDCDYNYSTSVADWAPAEIKTLFPDLPNITATAGIDRCIDWQNPALPSPSISISPFPTLPSSFGDAIKTIVTEAVDKAVNDLLKPENIASAVGFPISLPF